MTNPTSPQKENKSIIKDENHDSKHEDKENDSNKENKPDELVVHDKNDSDMESIEIELAAGAKAFAFKNYAIATECFSKACEKLNTHHSQNLNAIVDAHISYGKSLLRNAISLGGLLGGLTNSNLATENDNSTNQAHLSVPNGPSKHQKAGASTSKSTTTVENVNDTNPKIYFSGDSDEDEDGEEEEEEEVIEEPVTVEDELENAFQVLEFTRQTIQSQIDSLKIDNTNLSDQNKLTLEKLHHKLVDVYDLIAQVHQEGEQFELTVESYQSSLEIKKTQSNFAPGAIAETHLMIALALELIPDNGEKMKEAIGHIDEAIELMKTHLKNLELKYQVEIQNRNSKINQQEKKSIKLINEELVNKNLNEEKIKFGKNEKLNDNNNLLLEIEEIKSLVNELEAKREELKTVPEPLPMTEGDKALQAYLATVDQTTLSFSSSSNPNTVIHDLDSLVKKRSRPIQLSNDNFLQDSSNSDSKIDLDTQTPSKKPKI